MIRDTLTGLLIGAAGGVLFWLAGIPAPWLAGSMIAGVIAIFPASSPPCPTG